MNIPKKDLVERLLYVTLVLVFIGVGIAIYVAVHFGEELSRQVEQLHALNQAQAETIQQIKTGVAEVKADNQRNTLYLKCLLQLHSEGQMLSEQDCPQATISQSNGDVAAPVILTATPAPIPTPVPKPISTPTPPVTPPACRVHLLGLCLVQ